MRETVGGTLFIRVTVLVHRIPDNECLVFDPSNDIDPYWNRLWDRTTHVIHCVEGPTYLVAPDVTRLVQIKLALPEAISMPRIGACEVAHIADDDIPDIEGVEVLVRLELTLSALPVDLEGFLARLPFKAYRIDPNETVSFSQHWSILDHDWTGILPNLE